jgi:hypothetical protein
VIQPGFEPGTVVIPISLRCSVLDICTTRDSLKKNYIIGFSLEAVYGQGMTATHDLVLLASLKQGF